MKTSSSKCLVLAMALVVCCVTGLGTTVALAQSGDVTGSWQAAANNTVGTLDMVQRADDTITGTIFGDAIEGQYIPPLRRLVFVRLLKDGTPFQLYAAHVSGDGQRLAGSLVVWNGIGGASAAGVDYNFSAELESDGSGDGSGDGSDFPLEGVECGFGRVCCAGAELPNGRCIERAQCVPPGDRFSCQ
jgi:hypothetical protein